MKRGNFRVAFESGLKEGFTSMRSTGGAIISNGGSVEGCTAKVRNQPEVRFWLECMRCVEVGYCWVLFLRIPVRNALPSYLPIGSSLLSFRS